FGEVVGDPADPARPNGAAGHQPAVPELRSGPLAPADPAADPLGPPRERPPIDLSRLDAPLGPAPFLPPSPAPERDRGAPPQGRTSRAGRALEAGPAAPGRLPRRHEVAASGPSGPPARGHAAAPLPAAGRLDRPERPAPRQVAPSPDR